MDSLLVDNNNYYYIQDGGTPLHWAARENSKECLKLLLAYGAEVNAKMKVNNFKNDSNMIM